MDIKKSLLLLFDRPTEPVFMCKGKEKAMFELPDKYFTERYKEICESVRARYTEEAEQTIPLKEIDLPDLSVPASLQHNEHFSIFIPKHSECAARLIEIFMSMPCVESLLSCAVYTRDRVNSYLFNYALSVAILHRKDTTGQIQLPSLVGSFPDKFIPSTAFRDIREEAGALTEDQRKPVILTQAYTASDRHPEQRLWYFREDIGVNLHHWHWHLVYPLNGAREIINKDRRGELFYYMHEQILARYNLERFSNNLPRVKRLNNLRDPIEEGYFPKMNSLVASRTYPPRFENTRLSDLNRENQSITVDIGQMERWRDRIYKAIEQRYVEDADGNRTTLDEEHGIDILGNIVESTELAINRNFYGNLHNMGHLFMAYAHDPENMHLELAGVMGESATAMRDPVFYKWHSFIDSIFQKHKEGLPSYSPDQIAYDGIIINEIQVTSETADVRPNVLKTFWQRSVVDLSRGIDFTPRGTSGKVLVSFKHLQHIPFTYTINVENNASVEKYGTMRIFLAPKTEAGQRIYLRDQRLLMIELDKFTVMLNPGQNTIQRRSDESSVTIPFERTFHTLDSTKDEKDFEFNYCGCGWPQYMLIPKGLPEGMTFELFVMISNYEHDRIDQEIDGISTDAASYCGIRDRLYPDRRSMGYPFDRLPGGEVKYLEHFLTPNMKVVEVVIQHEDRIEEQAGQV